MGLQETLKPRPAWVLWLAAVTAIRALAAAFLPLTPEEAYHWNFAVHLDWSYYDHPPLIAWAIAAGRLLFGDVPFAVRFVPILFSAGTTALVARMAGRIQGPRGAAWAVLLLSIQPITLLASGGGFPDAPLLFFWALAMALVWRAIETGRGAAWLAAGAALGAGMLSKYTASFLVPSVFIYLVLSKRDRRRLATPWPYLAGVVSLAVFAPVILWNASHDWVSFRYQSVQRFQEADGFRPLAAVMFAGGEWLGILPLTLPLAVAAAWKAARSARPEDRFLFWMSAPMLGFFFLLSWGRTVHLMWPLPAYLGLTVLMAGEMTKAESALARFYIGARRWILGLSAAALVVGALHAAFFVPFISPIKGLYGWEVVAAKARELRRELPEGSFYVGIGRRSTCTSQLAFHLRAPFEVHGRNLLGGGGLQYDFWVNPRTLEGKDAVVVVEAGDRSGAVRADLESHFAVVEPAGEVVVPVGRRTLLETPPLRFALFRARGYRPPEVIGRAGRGTSGD
jgi:dolichol-phosphate mannosyltransferase